MAHFGGGGFGKGDGDDLAGVVDFAEQTQKAASEQIGLAGTGGRVHQNGASGVECAVALGLIGRRILRRRR